LWAAAGGPRAQTLDAKAIVSWCHFRGMWVRNAHRVLIACVREKRPIVQLHHRIAVIVVSLVALGAGCVSADAATARPHYTVGNAAIGYAEQAVARPHRRPGSTSPGAGQALLIRIR
jgi:hypothetical protein